MKIAYVCRAYDPRSNDDEGAVEHSLRSLGHDVHRYDESRALPVIDADLLLFNKWCDSRVLREAGDRGVVRTFWYWDLVDHPDPGLVRRCRVRKEWMEKVLPMVDIGFCTDGDWVLRVNDSTPGKCYWLPQGADQRVARETPRFPDRQTADVLFTGTHLPAASQRYQFVQRLVRRYGRRFVHVEKGVHGPELTELYLRSRVVVGPDSPVTDRYWSNRVYNVTARGGYLLHRRSAGLQARYGDVMDFYSDVEDLIVKTDALLSDDSRDYRRAKSLAAWERTRGIHTYYHACAELVRAVSERFGLT